MAEDFDIYADLDHIEREANKESQELLALKNHITELQKQVKVAEQEKADIIRRNEILLENVSSLLLTAKAELKRKDTMINDLRRQCDNIAFGRKNQVERNVNCANKFTQTSVVHTPNIGGPTMTMDCTDRLRSKSKNIDVVTNMAQQRDRERERVCKGQIFQEQEQNHGRDKSGNREIERYREKERNRDRDRYRDSDRERGDRERYNERDRERYNERDRERHSERHRKRSQERNRHKEHNSYERSSDKETHDVSRKKDLKHNDHRTRNEEKHAPVHSKSNEGDEYNKNHSRCSDNKLKCLDSRSESSSRKNPDKVTNAHANHVSKRLTQKNIPSKMKELIEDTAERPAIKAATNQNDHAADESFQITESLDTNNKRLGIQINSELRKQNVATSMPQLNIPTSSVSCSKSIDSDFQKDNEVASRSSNISSKHQQIKSSSSAADERKFIPKAQDDQKDVKVSDHQTQKPHSTVVPLNLSMDPTDLTVSSKHYEPFSEDDRLNTNVEKIQVSTVSDCEISNSGKENFETNSNKEDNTIHSGDGTVNELIVNPPASLIESSSTDVEFNSGDTRSIIGHEDKTESSKEFYSSIETKHVPTNVTNEIEKKKYKGKTSLKRTSEPELEERNRNPERKDLTQNELLQNTPTNNRQIRTISNTVNEVRMSNPSQLNAFTNESSANETTKTQELKNSEPILNVGTAHNEIRNESDNHLMLGNVNSNSELTLLNDAKKKKQESDESTKPKNSPVTAVVSEATNDKQQNLIQNIDDGISSNANNSHCFPLRDRRSNSCYSDVLQVGKHPPSATMSIQTYFMNFNVQEVQENEVVSCIEQSLPAQCVEPVNESRSAILKEATDVVELDEANSLQTDPINEKEKKPKTSTAEIIRERLRKKNCATLQKASQHNSEIPIPVIPFKRRLSIDSASIASKRYKLDTDAPVDGNKLSVSPCGKLSSTYFSQIALPITSALDSIPRTLKSPNFKQKAHNMLMTPMVVVHSPAKPSQDTDKTVQNSYYSMPLDDQSSLKNIMDSLLQTPIKNESSDNVSPPCINGLATEEDNRQNFESTNNENLVIYSTPLSTKPLSRFSRDDDPSNPLFRKSTSIIEGKSTLKAFGERKESCMPSKPDTGRESNPKKITASVQGACNNPSKQTTSLLDKHGDSCMESSAKHSEPMKRCPKQMLKKASTNGDISLLNVNNNCKTSPTKKKLKNMNVAPDTGKSPENDTAITQQPRKTSTSSANSISTKALQSKVVKTAEAEVSKSTPLKQLTNATAPANNNDKTRAKKENYKLVKTIPSKNAVNAFEKIGKRRNTQSSSKCSTEDEPRFSTPLINNSSSTVTSGTSPAMLTNIPMLASKRFRKEKNDDEKRAELPEKQSVEKDVALVKNGTKTLINYTKDEKVNPQQLEAQSTVSNNSIDLERLNPQNPTETSVPVNIMSTTTNTRDKKKEEAERSQCVVSNVTLNLSLADNASNNHNNRRRDTPVQHVREMRIVKESPSLMRVFITRK